MTQKLKTSIGLEVESINLTAFENIKIQRKEIYLESTLIKTITKDLE